MASEKTFQTFYKNFYNKNKRDIAQTKKINILEKQLKTDKSVYKYGDKKFKSKEKAQEYINKIKIKRESKAREKFNQVQARHELERIDRAIKKGKKLRVFEQRLKKRFPKGVLAPKSFYKSDVDYVKILNQLHINNYNDVGGVIIALGWSVNNEYLRMLGCKIYDMTKNGALAINDYNTIEEHLKTESSKGRSKPEFLNQLIKMLENIKPVEV